MTNTPRSTRFDFACQDCGLTDSALATDSDVIADDAANVALVRSHYCRPALGPAHLLHAVTPGEVWEALGEGIYK